MHFQAGGDGLDWRQPHKQEGLPWEEVGSVWGAERQCRLPYALIATLDIQEVVE